MAKASRHPRSRSRPKTAVLGAALGVGVGHLVLLLLLSEGAQTGKPPAAPAASADFQVSLPSRPPAPTSLRRRRPSRRRAAQAVPLQAPSPLPVQNAPQPPDYGRWTVRGGPDSSWRGAGLAAGCDPAALAGLPEARRRACVEALKAAADRDPDRFTGHGPRRTPINHGPRPPCSKALTKRLSVNCAGLGFRITYKF